MYEKKVKKHILFVIDTLSKGGAEKVLLQYAESLSNYYVVNIVALKNIVEYDTPDEVSIQTLLNANQKLTENIFIILDELVSAARVCDVVIGFSDFFTNYVAVLAAKLAHKPVILSVRNTLSFELENLELKAINRDLVQFSYQQANKILCVSYASKMDMIHSFHVSERITDILPNPVNIKKYNENASVPDDLKELFSDNQVLLAIGRLTKQKNFMFLLKAFAVIKGNVKLCIVGKGQEYEKLIAYAEQLDIAKRVCFLGHRDDIPALLQHSAMLVMTSLYEGQPNVVLEAMASGTLVIAPQIDSVQELIVSGESGLLYKNGDLDDLCQMIEVGLSDKNLVDTLVANAKKEVASHDIDLVSKRFNEVIEELVWRIV